MIIGVSGYARAGKDTVADYLVEKHGFTKLSFADPIREGLYRLNPKIMLMESVYVPLAYAVDQWGWDLLKDISPDARPLMQRFGTEVAREMFGDNFWVDLAMRKAQEHEKVVIADVRYANEATAIKSHGLLWRVDREGVGPANDHPSELAVETFVADAVLTNNGTMDDLYEQVAEAIRRGANHLWHGRTS